MRRHGSESVEAGLGEGGVHGQGRCGGRVAEGRTFLGNPEGGEVRLPTANWKKTDGFKSPTPPFYPHQSKLMGGSMSWISRRLAGDQPAAGLQKALG